MIWREWLQWRWSSFECKVLKGVFKMTYLFSIWSYNSLRILYKSFIFWMQTFQEGCFEFNNTSGNLCLQGTAGNWNSKSSSYFAPRGALSLNNCFQWQLVKTIIIWTLSSLGLSVNASVTENNALPCPAPICQTDRLPLPLPCPALAALAGPCPYPCLSDRLPLPLPCPGRPALPYPALPLPHVPK